MFSGTNGLEMTGMPVSISFDWNEEEGMAVIMPAFPVADNSLEGTEGIEAYTQTASRALVLDYYGEYDKTSNAHAQMEAYIVENGLSYSIVLEEFVGDPGEAESMDEVLTKIYYILD